MITGHYWLLMGFLMCGESSNLSRRVRRSLPGTLAGRIFLSLFMPGSGRGFLFAMANVWAAFLFVMLLVVFENFLFDWTNQTRSRFGTNIYASEAEIPGMIISSLFVSWYLSLVFLFNRFLWRRISRKFEPGYGPVISLFFGVVLVAMVSVGSFLIEAFLSNYGLRSSLAWAFNWYRVSFEDFSSLTSVFFVAFVIQAVMVLMFAVFLASRDFLVVAVETPERVLIERQPTKTNRLPVGESIDEIFGELPAAPRRDDEA